MTADYLVLPEARRHATREIYAVARVTLAVPGVEPVEALPFWPASSRRPGHQVVLARENIPPLQLSPDTPP